MTEHDPWSELKDLTEATGHTATPMDVSRVRKLGTQRRRRRHLAVGAVAAVLAVGLGGGIFTKAINRTDPDLPPIANTPTAIATPTAPVTATPVPPREVTLDNVITTDELEVTNGAKGEWIDFTDNARDWDEVSACQQDTFASLGATSQAGRSFRFAPDYGPDETPDPDAPHANEPQTYALALQFPDEATAKEAYETYRVWVETCSEWVKSRDYGLLGADQPVTWVDAPVDHGAAEFAMNTYRLPTEKDELDAYWETVGLLLDGDRLAVTVSLRYAPEYYYANEPGGDPDSGLPADPQFNLLAESARVLEL